MRPPPGPRSPTTQVPPVAHVRATGAVVATTGAVPVLITGVASEAAELPSTLTAAIVNV